MKRDTRTYEELRFDRLVEAVTDMVCEDFAGMAYRDVIDALGDVQKIFGREGGYEITEDMLNAGYNATRLPDGTPQFADAGFCLAHASKIYRAMLAVPAGSGGNCPKCDGWGFAGRGENGAECRACMGNGDRQVLAKPDKPA